MQAAHAIATDHETEPPALDPEVCYRATSSRDPRFDGRIFIGVRTTGVYCRPICPARTPRRENVVFYRCAAAAAEAGFRPCLRCRPEASPGTPAWLGTSATVSRALRHIAAGALDEGSVEDLAARLGVGARHLRRLFLTHLGASPTAIAQTRRVHFAKRLIDETDLPMTQVAFDAGFASVRRFNTAIRETYRRSPTELRRGARRRAPSERSGELVLRLSYRPPLDWPALVAFLARRATPGVEVVTADAYRRTVELDGVPGVVEVGPSPRGHHLLLRVPFALAHALAPIVERMRRLFDLGAVPAEIGRHLGRDRTLAAYVRRRPGLRVPGAWSGFELAARAVLGQQVTVKGATTLLGRLVARCGRPLGDAPPGLTHVFPTAEAVAAADLDGLGVPRARLATLRTIARAVADGTLSLDRPLGLEATLATLTALPGVGAWTAQYIAMRALGEPDAFPAGDLGLRRALAANGRPATRRELDARAHGWRPWRAYAAMHLWTNGAGR